MENNQTANLYEVSDKCTFQVVSVPNIALLQNLGLRAGTQATLQNRYKLGGPVLLRVEDTYSIALGKDIAEQIAVREVAAL